MRSEWIIEVLADLKAFAEYNRLDATAAGLDDAMLVAVAEISSTERHVGAPAPTPGPTPIPAAVAVPRRGANVTDLASYRSGG